MASLHCLGKENKASTEGAGPGYGGTNHQRGEAKEAASRSLKCPGYGEMGHCLKLPGVWWHRSQLYLLICLITLL